MPELEMPRTLVQALEEEHGAAARARRAWMAALPLIVYDVARRWSLDLGRPFQPAEPPPGWPPSATPQDSGSC